MDFVFELAQTVSIKESGETGHITGRAEYTNSANSYYVRYRSADGRAVEQWWPEDALQPMKHSD